MKIKLVEKRLIQVAPEARSAMVGLFLWRVTMSLHGKWTKEAFEEHHEKNSHIYDAFERLALQTAEKRDRYSAKIIFHKMRWEMEIAENNSDFKIDDGWISHYARKFMEDHPEFDGFFETRIRQNSYHSEV